MVTNERSEERFLRGQVTNSKYWYAKAYNTFIDNVSESTSLVDLEDLKVNFDQALFQYEDDLRAYSVPQRRLFNAKFCEDLISRMVADEKYVLDEYDYYLSLGANRSPSRTPLGNSLFDYSGSSINTAFNTGNIIRSAFKND